MVAEERYVVLIWRNKIVIRHAKTAEKKKVVMEARYEALAAEGGKRAVKKAIEKRQKKIGQREKRRRPQIREESRKRRRVE